ncbi:MAG: hypothetical protein JW832_15500, partial [Deltaproteobacteria bacterium]|nr:hypothetical protein [Deltaproteobacteria bacterium]
MSGQQEARQGICASRGTDAPGWPGGAEFALFLSHDVDQVHDRGLYRTLADINHLRRVLRGR